MPFCGAWFSIWASGIIERMKKCPYCGKEYPDEALVCAIDETELLSDNPEPKLKDPDSELSLVIVGTYRTVVDATLVMTRLQAAGIEACIPEEYTPQIFWNIIPSPLESVTVRVAAKDYEEARRILADDVAK